MIRYALVCDEGHGFDSWFANSAAYDKQIEAVAGDLSAVRLGQSREGDHGAERSLQTDVRRSAARRSAAGPQPPNPSPAPPNPSPPLCSRRRCRRSRRKTRLR